MVVVEPEEVDAGCWARWSRVVSNTKKCSCLSSSSPSPSPSPLVNRSAAGASNQIQAADGELADDVHGRGSASLTVSRCASEVTAICAWAEFGSEPVRSFLPWSLSSRFSAVYSRTARSNHPLSPSEAATFG